MAQSVRGYILFNSRLFGIMLYNFPKALAGHAPAVQIDEKSGFVRLLQHLRADFFHILCQSAHCRRIQRDDTLLTAAFTADDTGGQVQVAQIQIDQFGYTYSGGIEQFQHRFIPIPLGIVAFRLLQKQVDLFAGQDLRQFTLCPDRSYVLGGIGSYVTLNQKILVEGFQRGNAAGDGSEGLPLSGKVLGILLQNRLTGPLRNHTICR